MPRPQQRMITFTIDGREAQAPENSMLVDAAKHGDVEIPVFCYEPKLGGPVGACRMCLVEIEGIPKLQPGCATPVKDGMVVNTQTERVKEAQRGVVEFLLVNHPLDCPVCDKGGECPLQDISFGWGGGISRFVEPKRHFVKPVELSSKIAIDRERCILCYRCVRFSQDVSEDDQLVLLERGAHSYVATFDGHPYEAPFSGNIVELCPVGALTALPYRFKARPWDIEDAGTVCTLCPSQCNVTLTVRDEKVLRALARENPEVDDGWLCNRGRFVRDEIHGPQRITQPLIRDGGVLRPTTWERALEEAAKALTRAGEHTAALVGGQATNEEGFLLARALREGLGSPHIDSRPAGALPLELHRRLAEPALQAQVSDLEHAHAVLVLDCEPVRDMPIIDLRIRKGVRHKGVALAVATNSEGPLDRRAELSVRFAPGMGAVFAQALAAALSDGGEVDQLAQQAGADPQAVRSLATLLAGAGQDEGGAETQAPGEVTIVWGERLAAGEHGAAGAQALLAISERLGIGAISGAGLLEVPAEANGRGLREAGALPNAGPGLQPPAESGLDAQSIATALAAGELTALHLLQCDPLSDGYDRALWEPALERATTVIAHATALTEGIAEHANVIFPAESHAEKEGTIVHPDGRIQRLRPVIGRQGETRAGWLVLADLALALGLDLGVETGPMATEQLAEAVPFYAGLTLEEIGAKGVRWQDRDSASGLNAERVAG
ncbi:MAG TPA: NADH-quinone oxidoreductase subunit NuoG [Solirubrobacteraceae bacterium]|nr:NADH-quinone oxidoreductase subunit NuoG [Solirubrobacteraceae bacterium]